MPISPEYGVIKSPRLRFHHLALVGRVLAHFDTTDLLAAGLTLNEAKEAEILFDELDPFLSAVIGQNWDEIEAP